MKKKVLITGATGFVGKNIIKYLKDRCEVIGIARKVKENFDFPIVKMDLSKKIEFKGNFDAIIHTAGSLPYNENNIYAFKKNNIDAMVNLIEFAKKNNIPKFIFLSTIGVYGEFRNEIINENSDIINPGYYGLTKYMAELLLQAEEEIDSISLRMPGIIGNETRGIWFSNVLEKFRKNEDVIIYSPNFVTKNFVDIEDLSKFILGLIQKKKFEKKIAVLACSQGATIIEITKRIKKILGSRSQIYINNDVRKSFCIDNKSAIDMGYESLSVMDIINKYVKSK